MRHHGQPQLDDQSSATAAASAPFAMSSRLPELPSELVSRIFELALCWWSVIALRLTCRHLNAVYQLSKRSITNAQIHRIIDPLERLYEFMTTLHISPEILRKRRGWKHSMQEHSFARLVAQALPYFDEDPEAREDSADGIGSTIAPQTASVNITVDTMDRIPTLGHASELAIKWAFKWLDTVDGATTPFHELEKCDTRHLVILTSHRLNVLDTMHARVYHLGFIGRDTPPQDCRSFDIEPYCQWLRGFSNTHFYSTEYGTFQLEFAPGLRESCAEYGCPNAFRKEGLPKLEDWCNVNLEVYLENLIHRPVESDARE